MYLVACIKVKEYMRGWEKSTQMIWYICYFDEHVPLVNLRLEQLHNCNPSYNLQSHLQLAAPVTHLWLQSQITSPICNFSHTSVTPVTLIYLQSQMCIYSHNMWSWSHVDPLCLRLHLEHHLWCHSMPIFNIFLFKSDIDWSLQQAKIRTSNTSLLWPG